MKKKISKSSGSANKFVKSVLEVFQTNPFTGFNYKQVSGRLGLADRASKELVAGIIEKLFESEIPDQVGSRKFREKCQNIHDWNH
jgi:hypothetical protein